MIPGSTSWSPILVVQLQRSQRLPEDQYESVVKMDWRSFKPPGFC